MTDQARQIANSLPMWIATALAVALCLVQAGLLGTRAYRAGKKIGLQEKQMKSAMKSSLITSIGPSVVILTGLLSLFITVGAPMAWMRLSFIGSVMFETMAAGFGAEAVGVTIGSEPMTEMAFANAVWTMILGSLGWILVSVLAADKMDKVQTKLTGGNSDIMKVISVAAMLGSFGSLLSNHLLALNKNTVAAIAGAAIMLVLSPLADKKNIGWLREWVLAIALFGGMIVAAVLPG